MSCVLSNCGVRRTFVGVGRIFSAGLLSNQGLGCFFFCYCVFPVSVQLFLSSNMRNASCELTGVLKSVNWVKDVVKVVINTSTQGPGCGALPCISCGSCFVECEQCVKFVMDPLPQSTAAMKGWVFF